MVEPASGKTIILRSVASTVLAAALIGAAGFIPGAWLWIKAAAGQVWTHLTGSAQIPVWLFYILLLIAMLVAIRAGLRRLQRTDQPNLYDYTHDTFLSVTWRWRYVGGQRSGVWAYCPACDTQLVYSEDWALKKISLYCETCRRFLLEEDGDKSYLVAMVHRQIDRKIRKGDWKESVRSA